MINFSFIVQFDDGVTKEVVGELPPQVVREIASEKTIKDLPNRRVLASMMAMVMSYQEQMIEEKR